MGVQGRQCHLQNHIVPLHQKLIQLFGLRRFRYIFKICLQQLGYAYGDTTLLTSLTYQAYFSNNWMNYATWVDLFYDENGIADDTYTVLDKILTSLHLQIFQHKGQFILWDINDVYYRNDSLLATKDKFTRSLIQFNSDFNAISQGVEPKNDYLGYNQRILPINPPQNINYDRAFNEFIGEVSLDSLSLLYTNPSFELNAVQGQTPEGLEAVLATAYANYDPPTEAIASGAYLGDWQMTVLGRTVFRRVGGGAGPVYVQTDAGLFFSIGSPRWVHTSPNIIMDQSNKKINISFVWRPLGFSDEFIPVPRIGIFFTDSTSGKLWIYAGGDKGYNGGGWFEPDFEYGFFPCYSLTSVDDFDYLAWNSFNISTSRLPESGVGFVDIGVGNMLMPFNNLDPNESDCTISYDQLIITQSDADDQYNFQKAEKHIVNNLTQYAKAEKKEKELPLFTYPKNKRLSGNVSFGEDYITAKITNEWYFELSPEQLPNRLPANVIRRIAKNYQRPMIKWQGDIMADNIDFYAVYTVLGYNKVFIPFAIEMDLRNSVGNITLIEIDDTPAQIAYKYQPKPRN